MLDESNKNNTNRTWGSSISIDDTDYATSLFWQSLQNQDDPNAEVLESSQGVLEGADLFCVKKGKTPQFGICVSTEGYKQGGVVAASCLATALNDQPSFVAVFKVSNGWWYVCVRDDVILANGDMLYLSEEDAKRQFMSMMMVPDWKLRIAPPEWEIPDTLYPNLEEIMQRGAKVRLQKINVRGKLFYAIAGVGAFVALWILYTVLMSLLDSTPKVPVVVPIQPKMIQTDEVPPEPKPWENLPIAQEQMRECYLSTLDLIGILPPGWSIGSVSCAGGMANTSWSRVYGRISTMDKSLNLSGLNFAARSIANNGDLVMAAVPFAQVGRETSDPEKNLIDLTNTMNDLFQSIDQVVTLEENVYTSPQNNVYRSIRFRFSSNYNPLIWSDMLTKFSGLEINTIKYDPTTGVWEYEGAIYAL